VITVAPAGGKAGVGAVVEVGAVTPGVPGDIPEPPGAGDGRVVLVERPEPAGGPEDGRVVLVVDGTGPLVVVVEVEVVAVSESGSACVVVVVVEEGSIAGVVVVVVGSDGSVVVVVSVSASGSATAEAAGSQTTVVKSVVRARARRTRRSNTRITSPGVRGAPGLDSGSNGNAVEHIGAQRSFVTNANVPKR
jgi:hypothetical protein